VVLSSHLLHDVDRICERIVIIAEGKVVAHDTLASLKERRKAEAEIVISRGKTELITLLQQQGWSYRLLNNGNILVSHGQQSLNPLISLLQTNQISPLEIKESPDALNELYLQTLKSRGARK
jgi:ABC-2 type transport system ATP-binding protein